MPSILAMLLACLQRSVPPPLPRAASAPQTSAAPTVPSAGTLVDGVWTDAAFPLSVRLPAGWSETSPTDATRVTFTHVSGARLSVRAGGAPAALPSHADCSWEFDDRAQYRALRVTEAVRVASCVPDSPDTPRRSAWLLERDGSAYVFEADFPFGSAHEGRPAVEALLSGVRLARGG
jgi:hypothetical protein